MLSTFYAVVPWFPGILWQIVWHSLAARPPQGATPFHAETPVRVTRADAGPGGLQVQRSRAERGVSALLIKPQTQRLDASHVFPGLQGKSSIPTGSTALTALPAARCSRTKERKLVAVLRYGEAYACRQGAAIDHQIRQSVERQPVSQ